MKSAISALVDKFSFAYLAVKLSAINLLNFCVIIYIYYDPDQLLSFQF